MVRSGVWCLLLTTMTMTAVGCYTPKHDVSVPLVEEFKVAPKESRFDNPPEQGYRKPPIKKEFKPGMGGPGMGAPSMGGQGQGQ